MTPAKQRADLQNLLDLLASFGLAVWVRPTIIEAGQGGVARVTWSAGPRSQHDLFRSESYTIAAYREWLLSGELSAVLFDGAVLQITFDFFGNQLSGHRLAYLPCPVELDDDGRDLIVDQPILEVIDAYLRTNLENIRLRTPVRFDFDAEAAREDHPASHITFNGCECRVPVSGPLSLGDFVDFVFRNFYPQQWKKYAFLRDQPKRRERRTISLEQECRLHVHWRSTI